MIEEEFKRLKQSLFLNIYMKKNNPKISFLKENVKYVEKKNLKN